MHIKHSLMTAALATALFMPTAAQSEAYLTQEQLQQLQAAANKIKSIPPEQRQQMLNTATQKFQQMTPEQRQAFVEGVKKNIKDMTETQKTAYKYNFNNSLSQEQKKKLAEEIEKLGLEDALKNTDGEAPASPAKENKSPQ